jgi:hypothetical protein
MFSLVTREKLGNFSGVANQMIITPERPEVGPNWDPSEHIKCSRVVSISKPIPLMASPSQDPTPPPEGDTDEHNLTEGSTNRNNERSAIR